MQLIRAINKSNKSNNKDKQRSGANNNKVVIVAPPVAQSSVSQTGDGGQTSTAAPVSPSVALPALKKRTSIVKQSVPPPVPPRGSPRSKSNLTGVSCSHRNRANIVPKATMNVDRLMSLSSLEQSGCQKVKKWLETVELPQLDPKVEMSIPDRRAEQIEFKSVMTMAASFAQMDKNSLRKSSFKGSRISDSSLVKARVASYDSLEQSVKPIRKMRSSDGGTDSGIDIPARATSRQIDGHRRFLQTMDRFSRDGEFV